MLVTNYCNISSHLDGEKTLVLNCTIDQPTVQPVNGVALRIPLVDGFCMRDYSLMLHLVPKIARLCTKFNKVIFYCKWGMHRSRLLHNLVQIKLNNVTNRR